MLVCSESQVGFFFFSFSFFFQSILKDLEKRKVDLNGITESSAALQHLVLGSESVLEENLCVLNAGWSRVRTWTEDWCNTLLVRCQNMPATGDVFSKQLHWKACGPRQGSVCVCFASLVRQVYYFIFLLKRYQKEEFTAPLIKVKYSCQTQGPCYLIFQ